MYKKFYTIVLVLASFGAGKAQNVGIGTATPDASAKLDITDESSGLLIPRVALTSTAVAAPVTDPATSLLVYNTNTAGAGNTAVTPGFYYWNSAAWVRFVTNAAWLAGTSAATTNALSATGFLGTSTNQHVDFVSNNLVRGRLSNTGQFFMGGISPVVPGDLLTGISNASFPWAISGYSSFNGSGVYGSVRAGSTTFPGVLGEYNGTSDQGSGVRGIYSSTTSGANFTSTPTGLIGIATAAGSYKFGVKGDGGNGTRSGGVLGNEYGIRGALGYYASNGSDYAVYGFGLAYTLGVAAGRAVNGNHSTLHIYQDGNTELSQNANIGVGIYGGVMGGWVRGLKYGFNAKGETYSLYVDGQSFTNEPLTYLIPTATDERIAGFMSTSLKTEISDKGKIQLQNGSIFVAFDENFKKVMSKDLDDLIITATPQGNSAGVYISQISLEGFWIIENNSGQSNVHVAWTAISPVGSRQNIAEELLSKEFDRKMDKVMYNENNTDGTAQPLWWDGTQIRWDAPPAKQADPNAIDFRRPTGD